MTWYKRIVGTLIKMYLLLWNFGSNQPVPIHTELFILWERLIQSFAPLPRNTFGSFYASEQLLERRPDTLAVGGVFRLSGVRVVRGEQTPRGIQCHSLFVCPCWNVPSVQTAWCWERAGLTLCMKHYAFKFSLELRQKHCKNEAKWHK